MKFIDFNDKAIDCISIEQWRRLAKKDNSRCKNSEAEKDITLVCLSYDDGVRWERFDMAPHMAGKSKEVLHKELINCHFAEILYYGNQNAYWRLHLNIDKVPEFPADRQNTLPEGLAVVDGMCSGCGVRRKNRISRTQFRCPQHDGNIIESRLRKNRDLQS